MVGTWIKKGWEDYKKKWVTYVVLEFLILAVTAILLGGVLLQAVLSGNVITTALSMANLIETALVSIIVLFFVDLYFQAAILKTYPTDGDLGTVLREAAIAYLPFLGAVIILGLAFFLPIWILGLVGDIIGAKIVWILLGVLIGLYLAIKLTTLTGRVIFGESLREAATKAWNTPFIDDLKVIVALIIMAIVSGIIAYIPLIGGLIDVFVVFPITAATYMAAVEELRR